MTDVPVWLQTLKVVGGLLVSLAGLALGVLNLVFMYAMFRWITTFLGVTRRPMLTRTIGGVDIRKSRRGTDLPPIRTALRRLWCRRHVPALIRTTEGREKRCAKCGKDLEEGQPEQWV